MLRSPRQTLLVVDDEPDVLDSLRHYFRRSYRVLTAEGGAAALDLLRDEEVHLILSDQRMPGMTGDAFLAEARRVRPEAVRMLLTGYADLQGVIRAVNEGHIYRYIAKPWDADELETILRQAGEHFALVEERRRLVEKLQEANNGLTRANVDLAEAAQLKTAFLEVASHEFNTPITLLIGLSELLRLVTPDLDAMGRDVVEQIGIASNQLARHLAGTLTLLRADDVRRSIRPEPADLGALIRRVADQVHPFVSARRQDLRVEPADDLGEFQVDSDKIAVALLHVLTNAVKFTPDDGRIDLTTTRLGDDAAEIVVVDRGTGIDPSALSRIFDPFFTEFDTSCHSSGLFEFNKRGLGLGLSIARQFIEFHGGTIAAASTLGVGTSITIRLPRNAPIDDSPGPSFPPEP